MTFARYIFVVFLLVISSAVQAAKYAGDAFSLGVGGRGLALGGAVIAGPFDATAAYWNPAGMNRLQGRHLVAMHAETFGSLLNHDYIGYINAKPEGQTRVQTFGFYLYYLGGGGIKITQLDEFGRQYAVAEESHGDYLLSAALAGKLGKRLDFGITAKIIYRDIGTESGKGLTMDAGMLFQLNKHVNLGLMVTDITTGFIRYSGESFDEGSHSESIYPTVKPGIAIEYIYSDFTGRCLFSGDIKFEGLKSSAQCWSGPVSLDTHYGWEISYKEMIFGRAGFDIGRFTTGAGINIKNITIDLAYLHHSALDATWRVSAAYRF
ncbi:MAG: PorV/PorQ family protein [candidate division Zixibacteria bacterium]|nr:PorV/PorQ family protein [candidate division Zixibacteria bacterium]